MTRQDRLALAAAILGGLALTLIILIAIAGS